MQTEGTLAQYRKEMGRFEKAFGALATKKGHKKVEEMLAETRDSFDSHYAHMQNDLESSVGKIDRFSKMMITLQQEMKSRDEALKKVPANCSAMLKDLKKRVEANTERGDRVDEKFHEKVDVDTFEEVMQQKLDA